MSWGRLAHRKSGPERRRCPSGIERRTPERVPCEQEQVCDGSNGETVRNDHLLVKRAGHETELDTESRAVFQCNDIRRS